MKAAQTKSVREQFTRNGGIERSRGSRNLMGDLELTSNHDRKPESSRPTANFDVDSGSSADDDGDDSMVQQQQKLQEKLLNDLMLHDVAGPTAPVIDRFVRRRRSIAFGGVRGGIHATNGIETELEMAHLASVQKKQSQTMDEMSKKISEMMELLKAQQNQQQQDGKLHHAS
jgi:Mg2+ and Co2+ transporter CorA